MRFTDKHSDVVGKGYDVNLLILAFTFSADTQNRRRSHE